MKTLILYFSASGVTKHIAEELASLTNGDLQEIVPAVRYTREDLNWRDGESRSSLEMKDPASRPALGGTYDVSAYEKVYIGFPVWWYTAPRIINTVLETCDFRGKQIALFGTSGGSDVARSLQDLQQQYPQYTFVGAKLMNEKAEEIA